MSDRLLLHARRICFPHVSCVLNDSQEWKDHSDHEAILSRGEYPGIHTGHACEG